MSFLWLVLKIWLLIVTLGVCLCAVVDMLDLILDWKWHLYGLKSNTIPRCVLHNLREMQGLCSQSKNVVLTGIYVEKDEYNNPYGKYSFHFQGDDRSQYQIGASRHNEKIIAAALESFEVGILRILMGIIYPLGSLAYLKYRYGEFYRKITKSPKIEIGDANTLEEKTVDSPASEMIIDLVCPFKTSTDKK